MVVVSIISVLMVSLLGVSLLVSDLSRKSTIAFADSSSSFYSAESGLNRRAEKLRQQFLGFVQPSGASPGTIVNCITGTGGSGSGDFACETDTFNSTEPRVQQQGNSIIESTGTQPYLAYTYVQPNPRNLATFPELKQIPSGETFAGLTALEYNYRVFSTAIRRINNADINSQQEAQTVLQMDFNSRIIPLFQFAAFYHNDMEINPGADMTLGGRVHTNANLRLSPTNNLNFVGPVTASGNVYNSIGHPYPDATAVGGWVNFVDSSNNPVNDTAGNSLKFQALNYIDPALTTSQLLPFGNLLQSRVSQLQVPAPSFITKTDPSQPGGIGEYYGKADLQLEFLPNQSVPFKLTAIKTGLTPSGCSGVVISSDRQGGPFQCSILTEGQLRSLLQPVLVDATTSQQAAVFCPNLATATAAAPTVDPTRRSKVVRALAAAIAAQATPLPYASTTGNLSSLSALQTSFSTNLDAISGLTEKTALLASTPEKIAAINSGCLIPAPIQAIKNSFYDQREARIINLLQVNLRSLTAWNYYNISVDWTSGAVTNTYGGQGNNVDELLFQRDLIDATAPTGSLRGLAVGTGGKSFGGADRKEGGLVLHATIDKTVHIYPATQSPYGFAISQGSTLPAPLTVATDQAVYLQGDYNNIGKQPAAVMGDTITVLSNACWDNTLGVKGSTTNECGRATPGSSGNATETTINAAFLSRTDLSDPTASPAKYSGGLNNMMRFYEIWTGINFNYTGSLVSIGTPQEFSGRVIASGPLKYFMPPIRNWAYETNFNQFSQLPPLSPRVIYLQQQVFGRKF